MNYITTRETLEIVVRSPGQIPRYALIRDELNPGSLNGDSPRFRCTLACLVESFFLSKNPIKKRYKVTQNNKVDSTISFTIYGIEKFVMKHTKT